MKKSFSKPVRPARGATLLEILLVLGIGGLFVTVGIQLYQAIENMFHIQQLHLNVDQLFQATANYYKANCAAGDFSPNPPGFLSPYRSSTGTLPYPPAVTNVYPVSITSTLLAKGYLENWQPTNPLVDSTGGESGYLVQLNPIVSTTAIPVNSCVVTTAGQACLPITKANNASPTTAYSRVSGYTIPTSQALIVTWVIQVAVKITPQTKIGSFASILGADCMSDSSSPGKVDTCAQGNSSHLYLVWSRMPSFAFQKSSVLSPSMQLLKQYNNMYTHDAYYELSSGYSTTTSPVQAPVYYLCGG